MAREHEVLNDWGAELFVGDHYPYYKNQWNNRLPDQTFVSWNWPAFLVPVYWLVYRKMYLEAFLCFLAGLVLACTVVGFIVPHIIVGLLGNYLYYRKGLRVIKKTFDMTEYESKVYITKHGGTSISAVIFLVLLVSFIWFTRIAGYVGNL